LADYKVALSRLILDRSYRVNLGGALRNQILRYHSAEPWLKSLEDLYARSRQARSEGDIDPSTPVAQGGEPDVFIQAIHGGAPDAKRDTDRLLKFELGVLSTTTRLREWWRLFRAGLLRGSSKYGPVVYLLPEWLVCRVWRLKKRYSWS